MKILTPRNNKDYYDYLSGIYGIDENVVYDRREFTVLARIDSPFFSYSRMEKDAPKKEIRTREWVGRRYEWVTKLVATEIFCMLEIGLKWYFFKVERYLGEPPNVHLDWSVTKITEITKEQRLGSAPMTFFNAYEDYSLRWRGNKIDVRVKQSDMLPNPILIGTPITSLIPAQEVYDNLYAYISSLKDFTIIDTRTDIQKAESAGFDRKTSFRNIR